VRNFLDVSFVVFLIAVFVQAVITIFLTLFIWEDPNRIKAVESPRRFLEPQAAFNIFIPARHEEAVIGVTLRGISRMNYPAHLFHIYVICDDSDFKTIAAANRAIRKYDIRNSSVVIFDDGRLSKPHALNKALELATMQYTVIFDAEDIVHPDILNIANTLYAQTKADIIQAGVQIMNYDSHWFSSHNVLEYYFWFRSRMHYHTKVGMVPLGGNTVFFRTRHLKKVEGWDEECLTEDAEIGIYLSSLGAKTIATYDPRHVTKEETPSTVQQFIKQRTRWNQGFIQILRSNAWKDYDSLFKRSFCFYTLSFPFTQSLLLFLTPFAIAIGFIIKMPVIIGLLSFLPILAIFLQQIINLVGLFEFTKEQRLKRNLLSFISLPITYFPYQLLLSIGALRATYRELRGLHNWEKTAHHGEHLFVTKLSTSEYANLQA
jgi:cellulose synthase/poly-beta-1,6-N-acetylglucosamine synthase-like glycosyltransferase